MRVVYGVLTLPKLARFQYRVPRIYIQPHNEFCINFQTVISSRLAALALSYNDKAPILFLSLQENLHLLTSVRNACKVRRPPVTRQHVQPIMLQQLPRRIDLQRKRTLLSQKSNTLLVCCWVDRTP